MKPRQIFITLSIVVTALLTSLYFVWPPIAWAWVVFGPLIILGYYDVLQKKHTLKRNFPILGNFRYMLEAVRPEIMQYFVETDTQGRPINRIFRSLIYQRAKKVNDTTPFGTQMKVNREGYEWVNHSIYAKHLEVLNEDPRELIGGADCKQPYKASILNISAMSFGSLSKNAVMAMNKGAKIKGFAQNTGEGGISEYHLKYGGDLIWQIGTGYFGCRTEDGNFDPNKFQKKANLDCVKMIELKLSQGAKPGHGGILPAIKNTEEIAHIRGLKPHTDVHSPPGHTAFRNAEELMYFIQRMRDLSNGKPVGFKLCVGVRQEFIDICKAMISTGIKPDFITVDGGEGGTGAAPVEFTNSIGMPLRDGLPFVYNTLVGFSLKKDIKLIASGKIISAFHMIRAYAMGADLCNSARAMMMAVGCIQALQCNTNTCPVGVATQDKSLMKGLDVPDKAQRVANFHEQTLKSFVEMLAAMGLSHPDEINRTHINRKIGMQQIVTYDDLYPKVEDGEFLKAHAAS